jgi:hypothetical protein
VRPFANAARTQTFKVHFRLAADQAESILRFGCNMKLQTAAFMVNFGLIPDGQ